MKYLIPALLLISTPAYAQCYFAQGSAECLTEEQAQQLDQAQQTQDTLDQMQTQMLQMQTDLQQIQQNTLPDDNQ